MLKMFNACTTEIDMVDAMVDEILAQIDPDALSKNTVGILSCHSEFISSGAVSALCGKLPFDVVGCTTMAGVADGRYDMYMLRLSILTSDDVVFSAAATVPMSPENYERPLADAYRDAAAKLPGTPSLIYLILPFMADLSGANLFGAFDQAAGGVPIFGTVASDTTANLENTAVIYNGKDEKTAAAFILMQGEVNPQFIVTSLPNREIISQPALVTESEGCVVKKVNGMLFTDYLRSVGYYFENGVFGTNTPFMIDYGNGSDPVTFGFYQTFPDGSALFAGQVPEGATLTIGDIDYEGIIETAKITLEKVLASGKSAGFLGHSCLARYAMLAPRFEDEIKTVTAALDGKIPYAFSYAGGELCPMYDSGGNTDNRFHGYTFTACVF
jgi:hypothetical protein